LRETWRLGENKHTHTHTHTSSHPWEVLLNILCPY